MTARKKGISLGSAVLIVLVLVLWRVGTFDRVLVGVGLNAKPCVRNAFGATFCGSEATSYCENLANAKIEGGACSDILSSTTNEAKAITSTAPATTQAGPRYFGSECVENCTPPPPGPGQKRAEQAKQKQVEARESKERRQEAGEEKDADEESEKSERCEKLEERMINEGRGSEPTPAGC